MPSTGGIKINKALFLPLKRSQSGSIKEVCIKQSKNPSRATVLLSWEVLSVWFQLQTQNSGRWAPILQE